MPIEIDVPPDPRRLARLVKFALRRAIIVYRVIGLVALAGAVFGFVTKGLDPLAIALAAGGLATLAMPLISVHQSRKQGVTVNGPWHYTADGSGLVARNPVMVNSLAWAAFKKAEITATDVVLFVRPRGVVGIPRDRITPADQEQLTALLTAHGLLAPSR